jgi:hypothetical protein
VFGWVSRGGGTAATLGATIVAFVTILLSAAPANGQVAGETIRLVSQTTWWQPGEPFRITVDVTAAQRVDLEVQVEILHRVPNRTAFAATVTGDGNRSSVLAVFESLRSADADGSATITFTPTLPQTGVYPLRVSLRSRQTGATVSTFVTYLLHFPPDEVAPLRVALTLPFHARPSVRPDGDVAVDDASTRRLSEIARILRSDLEPSLSVLPTPETVEAIAQQDTTGTIADLAESLTGRDVIIQPWVNAADPPAEDRQRLIARGEQVRQRWLGSAGATVVALAEDGVALEPANTPVVIPERLLRPVRQRLTLAHTFGLEVGGKVRVGAAVDPTLASYFRGNDDVLDAQRLLADLAVLYDDDRADPGRGHVVAPEDRDAVRPAFLATLLQGLRESPVLRPVGLNAFFASVTKASTGGGRSLEREYLGDRTPGLSTRASTSLRAARTKTHAYLAAVDASDPDGAQVIDRLERTCLVSLSTDLKAGDRDRYTRGINSQVLGELSQIRFPRSTRSITLTAREGRVPVTVASRLPYPLRAVLVAATAPLEVPGGKRKQVSVAAARSTTYEIVVRAPTSGSFPTQVLLETPAGLVLDRSKVTVRSTAMTGVGTLLSLGAVAFLGGWWGRHAHKRRSERLVRR